jgi:flagella basal body P-ring formation protein FlgA
VTGLFRIAVVVAALVAPLPQAPDQDAQRAQALALIRQAVVERVGAGVEVEILSLDLPETDAAFREARPDPAARLGKPVRFTLVTEAGRGVRAVAELRVVADHVVMRQDARRAHELSGDDIDAVRAELTGTPLRELPTAAQVLGGRALRPLVAGQIVLPGYVAIPRAVEPGDQVTVVASVGAVQVSATFTAADGGRVGDVIRVVNPESRQYIKGRILRPGLVEVIHDR